MYDSSNLVQLALTELKINQKQLSVELAVSTGQISRWKNHNDYMSHELYKKLIKLCGLGTTPPTLALMTGSVANGKKWEGVIRLCAKNAEEDNATGYACYPLTDLDDWDVLYSISKVLSDLGVMFPTEVPVQINEFLNKGDLDDETWDQLYSLEHVDLISKIYSVFTDLMGFHSAYIEELSNHDDLFELTVEIQSDYLHLAACKVEISSKFAPELETHGVKWIRRYKQKLVELKAGAVEAKVPLREELLSLVVDDVRDISLAAERQSLGFNDSNLHPDVYMNELLQGMRIIHQVLPAILEKLGIEEIQLDESELLNG